jgi:hypothetical protein
VTDERMPKQTARPKSKARHVESKEDLGKDGKYEEKSLAL